MNEETATRDEVVRLVGERAENFYDIHKLCCSESVLLVMSQTFGAGIDPQTAVRLGSGFCGGMGDAGCTCGALGGAVMALGLFLGPGQPGGLKKKELAAKSKELHDSFRAMFGATCCRVLTKEVKHTRKLRRKKCQGLTAGGAELVAGMILTQRPDLLENADLAFLKKQDSRFSLILKKIIESGSPRKEKNKAAGGDSLP